MKIEVDPDAVFPAPLNDLQEVCPRYPLKVGLLGVRLDSPMSDWESHPIEASLCNFCNVPLGDESFVMFSHGGRQIIAHVQGQGVFVDGSSSGASGVFLVQSGNDERLCRA